MSPSRRAPLFSHKMTKLCHFSFTDGEDMFVEAPSFFKCFSALLAAERLFERWA